MYIHGVIPRFSPVACPVAQMDPSQTVETFNSSCTPALQWEVDPAAADGDHPIAQLETLYHYTNCSAAPSFNYSFGGFFNAENCVEVPLVVVATQTAVGIYAYVLRGVQGARSRAYVASPDCIAAWCFAHFP